MGNTPSRAGNLYTTAYGCNVQCFFFNFGPTPDSFSRPLLASYFFPHTLYTSHLCTLLIPFVRTSTAANVILFVSTAVEAPGSEVATSFPSIALFSKLSFCQAVIFPEHFFFFLLFAALEQHLAQSSCQD